MTTEAATYTELSRGAKNDGTLYVRVRPLNCSHDEHGVTVMRAVYAPQPEAAYVGADYEDLRYDDEPPAAATLVYRAAIEDDTLDAPFTSWLDSEREAIAAALTETCEFDDLDTDNLAGPDYDEVEA